MTVKAKLTGVKNLGRDKIFEITDQMDAQVRTGYVQAVAKDEKIPFEVALEMCTKGDNPVYTLGYKMASPTMMMMIKTKKGAERFIEIAELTPAEEAVFRNEVVPMNIRSMMKEEFRRRKKDDPEGNA